MKILIADDDRTTAQLLAEHLKNAGHQTVVAFDTMQALMICRREHPDAVLLDVQMPGGSGLDVLHRLKSSISTATVPVIVLTGHPETQAAALERGADAFLLKPPELPELDAILHRCERGGRRAPRALALVPGCRATTPMEANIPMLHNVLVVDDDRITANLIGFHLQRAGFATVFATDIPDCFRVLNSFRIDAVVLDLGLPSGSGLEVIPRLRSLSRTGDLPIFVVSATSDRLAAASALSAGASRFFSKAADMEALVDSLLKCLSERAAARSALPSAVSTGVR